jgi:hypothetical protein
MAAAVPSIEKATQGVKVSAVLEFLKHSPTKLLIGGKWVPAKSGKAFETINPANEEVLALVAEGDKADVDDAVKAARKAFEEGKWRSITPHQRTRYLLKLADLIDKYADELAELESLDNGKPVSQARAIDVTFGTMNVFHGKRRKKLDLWIGPCAVNHNFGGAKFVATVDEINLACVARQEIGLFHR